MHGLAYRYKAPGPNLEMQPPLRSLGSRIDRTQRELLGTSSRSLPAIPRKFCVRELASCLHERTIIPIINFIFMIGLYNAVTAFYITMKFCPGSHPSRKELPLLINGDKIVAQYDTGAVVNFMSKNYADSKHLQFEERSKKGGKFRLANGKSVRSLGLVTVELAFEQDTSFKAACMFEVMDDLAGGDLIMGRAFLADTQTLTSHRHRLRERFPKCATIPLLDYFGSSSSHYPYFLCHIHRRLAFATADTGSHVDVMSLQYARTRGFAMDRDVNKIQVQLGDTSIVETYGQVRAELYVGGYYYWRTFHILPNATSDIILGELTLEEVGAYTTFRRNFVNVSLEKRDTGMNIIVAEDRFGRLLHRRRRKYTKTTCCK